MKWDRPDQSHEKMVNRNKDTIEAAGHVQVIEGITRTWPGQTDSQVDQCWLNFPQNIISHMNEVRSSSDHNLISILVKTKGKITAPLVIEKRTWKDFSPENFRQEVRNLDWSLFNETENLDTLNTIFEENVRMALDKTIPMKFIQSRKNHRNWVDHELKTLMQKRDNLRESARLSASPDDWHEYRQTRNRCTKMLRNKIKKTGYMTSLYNTFKENRDIKGMYKTTKDILGWSPAAQPTSFIWEGKYVQQPAELANILQTYFTRKIVNLMSNLRKNGRDPLEFLNRAMNRWSESENLPTFRLRQITESETLKLISKLGNSTSHGRDKLDAKSLKCARDYLAAPITKIINSSIVNKHYIMKWKLSNVTPILKSTELSRMSPSSYRPISILPVLSKLVERTVQLQLLDHFENNQLFHHNGHAYRPNLSTSTALMQLSDSLYMSTDNNMISSLMAIDQSAAFDCVNHSILIRKLAKYNCHQDSLDWFSSYLGHRTQQIKIGRHVSRMTSLDRGVPQGFHTGATPLSCLYQ